MFEALRYAEWESEVDPPEVDLDALQARHPWARRHFEDDPDWTPDPLWLAELDAMPPERPERIYLEEDRPLHQRDPESLSDAEAITRLVQVEADIAGSHALRAQLIALVAAQRPAAADRPADQPGAAGPLTTPHRHADPTGEDSAACTDGGDDADVVPEILEVSEWLPHELQMAHPYSWTAVQDLVRTSLVLTGRLSATLALLRAGRIDYIRARILADLLGSCTEAVPTPWKPWCCPRHLG